MAEDNSKSAKAIGAHRKFNAEIATSANNPYTAYVPTYGGAIRLYSQDELLQRLGGYGTEALAVYTDLLSDAHVQAVFNKQFSEICSKEPTVEPATDSDIDKRAADFCQSQLAQLDADTDDEMAGYGLLSGATGFDALCRGLLLATLTGIQSAELVYKRTKEGLIGIDYAKMRDIRLFSFDENADGRILPRLRSKRDMVVGQFVPARKFVFHRHWAMQTTDPLGQGLGRYLYYPVQWKREALTYSLILLDKFADPAAVGTYPRSATEQQIADFYTSLRLFGRDTRMALQEGFSVSFPKGDINGSVDLLNQLVAYCDKSISLAVLGEATTGEALGGSQARETINNSIRLSNAKAWSDELSATLQGTMLKWLCRWNFPTANVPRINRNFTSVQDLLDIARTYKQIGLQADPDFIAAATGVPIVKREAKKAPTIPANLLK